MKANRPEVLPLSLPPRGLAREQAAAYVGISTSLFDRLIREGTMPKPKRASGRTVWDRLSLDRAFVRLPGGDEPEEDDWLTEV
ncbi:helix-turn-helix transcriptional regulator [Rhizobium halophytocola]|uniref:DNA-binding transcriptional regulator AlpA n=1 Tax=Rhizobium halophytocola TaxID=735519 RepID=A0ABS4E2K2_9HYPH|nr:hypothetical protein [Rhizobium halophytocola]MBP1852148.1 putative DNA-binding transcriptional regulator AlpA [Rhizobium halophytocola]